MMHRSERRDVAPKAALALGITFNELATNAVKYGALSNAAESILIEWTIEAAPHPGFRGSPDVRGQRLKTMLLVHPGH